MHYLSLYLEFIKLRIMEVAEYRKAFIAGIFAQFAAYGAEFLLIWVLINRFESINGWSPFEVMMLYALNLGSYAIAGSLFFNTTTNLSMSVKNGTFDEVLTKPVNSFFYVICRDFNSAYISHFLLSAIVFIVCVTQLGIQFSIAHGLFLAVTLIGAVLIQSAGFIITSVPAFWIVESSGLRQIFFFDARSFIRYPISIYNKVIQVVMTFVLPYAFINFYPAQYFLGKEDFMLFHPMFQYLCPVVGLALFAVAYRFWFIGLNRYQGTGS